MRDDADPDVGPDADADVTAGLRPDGRRERWRVHREARRRELVRAVADVARRRGPVGMDEISAETGVAKQVYYRYFADKADLHRAVGRAAARAVVVEVTRCLEAEQHPREQLRAGIDCYLRLLENEPELYRYVVQGPVGGGEAAVIEDYSGVLGLQVTRVVGDWLRRSGLDAGAAEPWGFAVVGAVRSAADRWLASPTLSREALTDYLTAYLWNGLSVTAPSPAGEESVRPLRAVEPPLA